jgi:phage gp36-like protein
MNYVTTTQLADRPGPRELAQVATPESSKVVADSLMLATLTGADRAAWPTAEIAVADAALARISAAQADTDALIDGHLACRYALPLAVIPPVVTSWARAIVRYKLHANRISDEKTDPIARDYRDALKFLSAVQAGSFSLGAQDPVVTGPETDVRFASSPVVFGRDQMRSFR